MHISIYFIWLMKFKADCSFLLGDTLAPNCMAALCLPSALRLYNFVAFILTGYLLSNLVPRVLSYPPYGARERDSLSRAGRREPKEQGCLLSTRMITNRMCPELRILTLLSIWLNYKNTAFEKWAAPRRCVLISFGWLYLHVYCILFTKSVAAGINFKKYSENSI